MDWYTWHFSTQGLPACIITDTDRGLLPHIFTLTVLEEPITAVIFCGTFSFPKGSRLLAGALLYTVRTFLPFIQGSIAQLAVLQSYKILSSLRSDIIGPPAAGFSAEDAETQRKGGTFGGREL